MISIELIWAVILAFAIFAYIVLDGFDLGIGIIYPFLTKKVDRDMAMNSVAPIWDGNETWLILGGGGLFAAFPLAYSIILPALYAPLTAMLIGLILRGVAFEFRWKSKSKKNIWDQAFILGSIIATLMQGIALGAFIQGIDVEGRAYAGGWWDWLSPFSVFVGFSLISGYALLGSTWLIMKTEGDLKQLAIKLSKKFATIMLFAIFIVSVWTPLLNPEYFIKWFSWPFMLYALPVPLLVFLTSITLFYALKKQHNIKPFLMTVFLFLLSFIGFLISIFPHIVPPSIDIWGAASPETSLKFLLVGVVIFLPVILIYTSYTYWVFRGKVKLDDFQH